MDEPACHTEERYCYLCLSVTTVEVVTYRAYSLSQCLGCYHVTSNDIGSD